MSGNSTKSGERLTYLVVGLWVVALIPSCTPWGEEWGNWLPALSIPVFVIAAWVSHLFDHDGVGAFRPWLWLGGFILGVPIAFWMIEKPLYLSASNTAYEYLSATPLQQAKYIAQMCKGGRCLTRMDWDCGFSNGNTSQVEQCFDETVQHVATWEKLERIQQYCGARYSEFTDTLTGRESDCVKSGGKWAVRSQPLLHLQQ